MTHTVQPGDIFASSWGYEQTNVTFYEVVRATEKTAWLVEIAKDRQPAGFMSEDVTPKRGEHIGEVFRRKLATWANPDEPAVKVNDYENAYLWDGKPKHATHYA